jgi:phosphoribosyl-ATP pyrophosphohydrolase/phosphoribosyl-AMP cyclohydrolase
LERLKFGDDGLLPVVIADARTGDVLTVAWANREALEHTLETRETHLYSRARRAQWRKGEQSGNTQHVTEVLADCDGDALLYRVIPNGPACHTGSASCFETPLLVREADGSDGDFLRAIEHLRRVLRERKNSPPVGSYVAKLYSGGVDRIGKKIGEEAAELIIAAKNADDDELIWEASDLLFHVLVLLESRGISLDRVGSHLLRRARERS